MRAASTAVVSRKVHPFALWAFLLLPASLVMLFLIDPRQGGEVAGSIYFGAVALVSIVFATLAIRDIRREPDRFFGTALALFGALAIPLLILNTLVIFNVGEINPYSIVPVKQKMSEHFGRMEQRLRQVHIERHGHDVPFEPPTLTQHDASALRLSETEKWIGENAPMLPLLIDVAIIGSSLVFSILLFIWLYRRCRLRDRSLATGPHVSST